MDPTTELVIENRDELVAALRSRKEFLQLSNSFVEAELLMTAGGCDKVLGPSQTSGFSIATLFDLVELFGARLVFRIDEASSARMAHRWERRDERAVRRPKRISKELLKIAKPLLFADLGRSGGKARAANIPATLASKIGRKAGRARMRQLTREQRSEFARAAALSRWNQHRAAAKAATHSEGLSA
jgi:hypothetical protein